MVAEDEKRMAHVLRQALEEAGYHVSLAHTGFRALDILRRGQHDLAILDIMLPGIDGFGIIRTARDEGVRTPILVLTAKDALEDRVTGLDLGADDYLLKPFRIAELLARVRAQIRRSAETVTELRFGDLEMNTTARSAKRGRRDIKLSATEFAILELLMRHPESPVTKRTILQRVWNETGYRDPNLVEVYIRNLRDKVEIEDEPRLLRTVRGKGYMISVGHDCDS